MILPRIGSALLLLCLPALAQSQHGAPAEKPAVAAKPAAAKPEAIAPATTAIVDFITHTVGWKTDARYYALSYDVNSEWDNNRDLREGAVGDLRQALAADPKLQVLIVHGWNDLSCPFMGSLLTQNQLPAKLASQVQVHEFPGGHMFYTRPANGSGLHALAETMVKAH